MRRAKHQAGETSRRMVEESSFQTVQPTVQPTVQQIVHQNTIFEGASNEEISQYLQEPKPNCEKKTD